MHDEDGMRLIIGGTSCRHYCPTMNGTNGKSTNEMGNAGIVGGGREEEEGLDLVNAEEMSKRGAGEKIEFEVLDQPFPR